MNCKLSSFTWALDLLARSQSFLFSRHMWSVAAGGDTWSPIGSTYQIFFGRKGRPIILSCTPWSFGFEVCHRPNHQTPKLQMINKAIYIKFQTIHIILETSWHQKWRAWSKAERSLRGRELHWMTLELMAFIVFSSNILTFFIVYTCKERTLQVDGKLRECLKQTQVMI